MKRFIAVTALLLTCSGLQAAMLPFTEEVNSSASEAPLDATLSVTLPDAKEYNTVIVKLTNMTTNKENSIGSGSYKIQPGTYELEAFIESLEGEVDPAFTRYKIHFTITNFEPVDITIPEFKRRRYSTWADYFTITLQAGSLSGDYEVTSVLSEYYTKLGIPNSYPEVNALSENNSNSQSRIGFSLNYKHFFSASNWMMSGELFTDADSNQSLNRLGFSIGAGKYWNRKKSNYWLAGSVGNETAEWNNIHVGGDKSVSISGKHDAQSFNVEAGMIYRPLNTSISVKFDLNNQSLMLNVGYVFGNQKKGYIDPLWVD